MHSCCWHYVKMRPNFLAFNKLFQMFQSCLFFCSMQGVLTSLMQTTRDGNGVEAAIIEVTS